MNPKFYIVAGWLLLLGVAAAPTFTNKPLPERKFQTFKVESSTTSSLPLPQDSSPLLSDGSSSTSSSSTSTTVETVSTTSQPSVVSTLNTTTTLIPETTTTTVLMSGENGTPMQNTLSVIQVAQMSLGKSRTELGFSNFWCTEFTNYIFQQVGRNEWINEMASPGQQKSQMPSTDSPQPGDLGFISFFKNGQTDHVVIVESVNEDGSVVTIEGNYDPEYVVRNIRYKEEITGYGSTQHS